MNEAQTLRSNNLAVFISFLQRLFSQVTEGDDTFVMSKNRIGSSLLVGSSMEASLPLPPSKFLGTVNA